MAQQSGATVLHLHYEKVEYRDRQLIGECTSCGQQTEYDPEGLQPPRVIKEGVVVTKVNYEELPDETRKMVDQELQATPVPPKPRGTRRIYEYYEANKEAIIRDLQTLGPYAMRKRWGISMATWKTRHADGRFSGLAARWQLLGEGELPFERKHIRPKRTKLVSSPMAELSVDGGSLPSLPAWNEGWTDAVKVKWLEAWSFTCLSPRGAS